MPFIEQTFILGCGLLFDKDILKLLDKGIVIILFCEYTIEDYFYFDTSFYLINYYQPKKPEKCNICGMNMCFAMLNKN